MSKSKDFELLVTEIERMLQRLPGTKVEHDVKLKDRSGSSRQIDVLVSVDTGRAIFKTIIECKSGKKRVNIGMVDALRRLVDSTGVHQGIIVAEAGFQRGAIASAKECNIHIYELAGIKDLNNFLNEFCLNFYNLTHHYKDIFVGFTCENPMNNEVTQHTKLFDPFSKMQFTIDELARQTLLENGDQIMRTLLKTAEKNENPIVGETKVEFKPNLGWIYQNGNKSVIVAGFRAAINSALSIKKLDVVDVREYKEYSKVEPLAIVIDFNADTQIQAWINDTISKGFKNA